LVLAGNRLCAVRILGAALLSAVAGCWISAASVVASSDADWSDGGVVGLIAAGVLCLIAASAVFAWPLLAERRELAVGGASAAADSNIVGPARKLLPDVDVFASSHAWGFVDRPGVVELQNFQVTNCEEREPVSLEFKVWQKLEGKRPLEMSGGRRQGWTPLVQVDPAQPSDLPRRLNLDPGEGGIYKAAVERVGVVGRAASRTPRTLSHRPTRCGPR
jgi:hypothetical protein